MTDELEWQLGYGAHSALDPCVGGGCVNEAALVVAGLEYRAIHSAADVPVCFSPTVAAWGLLLNDSLSDEDRQRLLVHALRFSGTAQTLELELARLRHLITAVEEHSFSTDVGAARHALEKLEAHPPKDPFGGGWYSLVDPCVVIAEELVPELILSGTAGVELALRLMGELIEFGDAPQAVPVELANCRIREVKAETLARIEGVE